MLKSESKKIVTYVGHTKDLKKRIKLHNSGKGAKFTRGRKWKLIYKEKHNTKKVLFNSKKKNYVDNFINLKKKIIHQ